MRIPSPLGAALLVAAVLSTSALPPTEHLRIVPAGAGAGAGHAGDGSRLAGQLPGRGAKASPAAVAIAGRGQAMGPLRACELPLAGPALRVLAGGELAFCERLPPTP